MIQAQANVMTQIVLLFFLSLIGIALWSMMRGNKDLPQPGKDGGADGKPEDDPKPHGSTGGTGRPPSCDGSGG